MLLHDARSFVSNNKKQEQTKQIHCLSICVKTTLVCYSVNSIKIWWCFWYRKIFRSLFFVEQGKEFLIDCVVPPSAPARGPNSGNRNSSQVLIVVTNHTHFPQGESTCTYKLECYNTTKVHQFHWRKPFIVVSNYVYIHVYQLQYFSTHFIFQIWFCKPYGNK